MDKKGKVNNSKVNNASAVKKPIKVKISKDKAKVFVIGLVAIVIVLIVVVSNLLKPVTYTENIKRVRNWTLATQYDVATASEDAMKHVKWKDKKGVVTMTGKDRKTGDKIVVTFKVGTYITFDSMTRDGKNLEYSEWKDYMKSYKD